MLKVIADKKAKPVKKTLDGTAIRTYRNALGFIESLTNYERLIRPKYDSSNFGLTRMNKIMSALGNPHRDYKTAHIAGTKGKGSTATMLAVMLQSCGFRVGLYTSPHILSIRERIAINGEVIGEQAFAKTIAAVVAGAVKAKVHSPTYFEVLTAAAFQYFSMEHVDIAVVETGLGGRLDATNVVSPEVVGITNISYDHVAQLGAELTSIAAEKAGIIKKKIPVVSAPQKPEVRDVLKNTAESLAAPLRFSDEDVEFTYRFEHSRALGRHARICLTTPISRFEHLHVPLLGEHQAQNCGLALTMLDTLKSRGMAIDDQKAMDGLSGLRLLGRMQMISEQPRIIVDGAHNAASVDALMRAIGQHIPYDSMIVIFGCNRDKDVAGMIRRVQLGADKAIFTTAGLPRSADPAELAAEYTERSGKMAQVAPNLDEALRIAMSALTREDLICITGSFYLVADALRKYGFKANSA